MSYKKFSKEKFKFNLIKFKSIVGLTSWQDVTEQIASDMNILEYVYEFKTKNKSVSILIYSSVDKRTNETRDNGSDAVRVVFRWTTKNGVLYKRIKGKLYRVDSLFDNLRDRLSYATSILFNLPEDGWSSSVSETSDPT